ncbi:MAG: hypothetical protein WD354_02405 [Acidimicrobiia bacterium]
MRWWIWVLCALAVTATVTWALMADLGDLAGEDSGPRLGANGTIAYGAGGNIRAVNPDGTGDERVIGERGDLVYQACPLYSPDGSLIAHHANDKLIIHRVDQMGHPVQVVESFDLPPVGNLNEDCGKWSSSGSYLTVATADAFGQTEGWLVVSTSDSEPAVSVPVNEVVWGPDDTLSWGQADGVVIGSPAAETIRVLTTSATPTDLAWSPDGNNLAFTAVLPGDEHPQLFLISADGTNEVQLTQGDESARHPAWSADGRRLAYVIENCTPVACSRRLVVFDGDRTITFPEPDIAGLLVGEIEIRWAPNAESLLYVVSDSDELGARFALIMSPTNGDPPYLVASESVISSFDWQRR